MNFPLSMFPKIKHGLPATLLILTALFLAPQSLCAQESDPELAAYRAAVDEYKETGVELFLYYPLSFHLRGWSYPEVEYEVGFIELKLPGPNFSFVGLGGGAEVDLGSRKPILKDMGFGALMELSMLSNINMKDSVDHMGLLLAYGYLYYQTKHKSSLNWAVKAGMGMARAFGARDLYDSPEEKEDTAGPMYSLEGAMIFPEVGSFRFQIGMAYRVLLLNSNTIHMFTPMFRGGYRF